MADIRRVLNLHSNMKKALCKHCALAVVTRSHKFLSRRRRLPGGMGQTKFNQLEYGHYLYLQTQFGEDQCTQFQVIVVTDLPTHRQD